VPDLLLTLSAPGGGGKNAITHAMDLPCFHPCVRLARWRDKPGELSFVPPDGRFVLAGYECNLLPAHIFEGTGKLLDPKLELPASVEIRSGLGAGGDEVEVKLLVMSKGLGGGGGASETSAMTGAGSRGAGGSSRFGASSTGFGSGGGGSGTSTAPVLDEAVVTIPVSPSVRHVADLRCSKGEAHHLPSDGVIEWRVSSREAASIGAGGATLRCTLVGPLEDNNNNDDDNSSNGMSLRTDTFDYDDGMSAAPPASARPAAPRQQPKRQSAWLMPRSASVSFSIRGWLASGIKVESLQVNAKASKGLGQGVTPYKGVKYHTVSRRGVEVRC